MLQVFKFITCVCCLYLLHIMLCVGVVVCVCVSSGEDKDTHYCLQGVMQLPASFSRSASKHSSGGWWICLWLWCISNGCQFDCVNSWIFLVICTVFVYDCVWVTMYNMLHKWVGHIPSEFWQIKQCLFTNMTQLEFLCDVMFHSKTGSSSTTYTCQC